MLLKRVFSGLLLAAFALQSSGVRASPSEETPSSITPIELKVPVKKNWVRNACEWTLSGYTTYVPEKMQKAISKGARFAGYIVPVIPFWRTMTNKDKKWFVLIESPMFGLVTTPLATLFAYVTKGIIAAIDGSGWSAAWSSFTWGKFATESGQMFGAYEGANIVRNGVNIDESLSKRQRAALNWFFTFASYSFFTAGGIFYSAQTPEQFLYAYSMVAFSGAWPILSQALGTYLFVPILFSRFPKKSLLDKMQDPAFLTADLLRAEEQAIEPFRRVRDDATLTNAERNAAAAKIKEGESNQGWIRWFREGCADGQAISPSKAWKHSLMKLGVRSAVAVSMVTAYLLVRWWLVGPDVDHPGHLNGFLKFMQEGLNLGSLPLSPADVTAIEQGLSAELSQTLPKME